jgi:hypothetical protein
MTSGNSEDCSTQPSSIAAQYETLRMAALGEALPPEARSGLMLFLRRGMWGWARTLTVANARQEPIRAPSSCPTPHCEPRGVIHVFAAMAMNTNNRRTP